MGRPWIHRAAQPLMVPGLRRGDLGTVYKIGRSCAAPAGLPSIWLLLTVGN
jgi:hypothetical protein